MCNKNISCFRCVDSSNSMVKNGKSKQDKQRYRCLKCGKTRIEHYTYKACASGINEMIVSLTKEGLGIRSIARILKISTTTLLRRIVKIAENIKQPAIRVGRSYEVDEMRSFIKRKDKLIWIVCALEKTTKKVVSFSVGSRTNVTLSVVLNSLMNSDPIAIYTDKLKQYKYLINKRIHKTVRFGTNHIERMHLTLRTHLKRLNRRTICFSRSKVILISVLKIYFWFH